MEKPTFKESLNIKPYHSKTLLSITQKLFTMRKFMLLIIIIPLGIPTLAQTGVGIKAGFSSYALTGEDKSFKNALLLGAFAQIPVVKGLVIQPEILFSPEGNKFELDDKTISTYLTYINIPVMLKLHVTSGVYVEAGPQIGFLMSAKNTETGSPDVDIKKVLNSSSFSGGAGVHYQSKKGFGIGFRYNFGLNSIYKNASFGNVKSVGGIISLSYKFSLVKNKSN